MFIPFLVLTKLERRLVAKGVLQGEELTVRSSGIASKMHPIEGILLASEISVQVGRDGDLPVKEWPTIVRSFIHTKELLQCPTMVLIPTQKFTLHLTGLVSK